MTFLSVGDMSLDSSSSPSVEQVKIKVSKTNPFRKGGTIFGRRTDYDLGSSINIFGCERYFSWAILYFHQWSTYLCRSMLGIGAATVAASVGVENSKTLGRCQSSAYLSYICEDTPEKLTGVSKMLSPV